MQINEVIRTNEDRDKWIADMKRWRLDKPVELTAKLYKKPHSRSQQGLYFGPWMTTIVADTGNDKDDLHDVFKRMFLEPEEKMVLGHPVIVYSTKNLDTAEFSEFMMKVEAFAGTELGIMLPQPDRSKAGWA